MPIFEQFDVVVVPFPFTDSNKTKRRPALVISTNQHFNSPILHSVMAMITSATDIDWPLDVRISDLELAGLKSPSIIRMKLFTLDHRLIIRTAGRLGEVDSRNALQSLGLAFNLSTENFLNQK